MKIDGILSNPLHIAHRNVSRRVAARQLYVDKFRNAEMKRQREGRALEWSFADAQLRGVEDMRLF
jgi:hypothetical protein